MSHHLDTPLAAQNGQLFVDDLYVFSAAESTVFIMDVNSNITGVHVKPGFHHEARLPIRRSFPGPAAAAVKLWHGCDRFARSPLSRAERKFRCGH